MRSLLFLFLVLDGAASNRASDELLRLTQQRFDANVANDRAAYDRLLAPHFLLIDADAHVQTKQEYLEAEFGARRADDKGERPTVSRFRARVEGDTAVTTYDVVEPHTLGEQRFDSKQVRVDTYARLGGTWRLVSMAVALSPSWPEPVAVDPKVYAEYAGTYRIAPGMLVKVTHEAGHLMAEVTGQPKVELFPEDAVTFFDKTDNVCARTVFERDAAGRVVAQSYRAQGQRVRAPKID